MKLFLALTVCYLIYCVDAGKKRYDGYKLFSVTVNSEEEADVLKRMQDSVDIWSGILRNKPSDVLVAPEKMNEFVTMLTRNGIPFVETVPDIQKIVEFEQASLGDPRVEGTFANHYTPEYKQVQAWMENIANTYSFASVYDFGQTYEGREIQLIKLSTGDTADKPIIFIDSGIHAREWLAVADMIWLIEELTASYGKVDEITTLLDKYDFYLVPVFNPDGYQYTHDRERFWRKNRSPNENSRCYGTDLNRNYDYPRFGGPSTSADPCSDLYKGTSGLSELESQHLRDFLTENKDRIAIYHSNHAYSQMWFTPWAFTEKRPDDAKELDEIAHIGSDALFEVHGTRFEVGPPSHLIYSAGGSTMDWVKGTLGIKYCSAMELRPGPNSGYLGFIVDPDEVEPSGEELLAGYLAAFSEIDKRLSQDDA